MGTPQQAQSAKPTQQHPPKHVPQRMCVVCRTTAGKRTLTRLVRTAEDGVQLDPTGKRAGRGAYLCDQPACWQRASDSDVLAKALRTTLTEADRLRLREGSHHPPAPSPSGKGRGKTDVPTATRLPFTEAEPGGEAKQAT